jgi:hypothetical protein
VKTLSVRHVPGKCVQRRVALGYATARWLRTELYEVTPADPVSYFITVPTLVIAVALAAWLPARRATRVSPLECLRTE